jgi:hypothetical protein
MHWDLGGLAYEMAIRDHFRLDVLVRRAAQLQERDAELAEVQRLLRLQDSASAGACPSCGAPHSRGAVFCWQCGTTLMERVASSAVPMGSPAPAGADEQNTMPIGSISDSTTPGVKNSQLGRTPDGGQPASMDPMAASER